MHGSLERPALRLEQRPNEEAMTAELKATRFTFRRARRDLHRAVFEDMLELRIQPVIATESLFTGLCTISIAERAWLRDDDLLRRFDERALQAGEQGQSRLGMCFRMLGLREPKHISGVFQ
jgi:hypothetical protein